MAGLKENLSRHFSSGSGPLTGTYALVLVLTHSRMIRVGKLGRFLFPAGYYVYIGSAFGPGGLASRIHRHLKKDKRLHWHIDYLRKQAVVEEVWISRGHTKSEHVWARFLENHSAASIPVKGFGCSDCTCSTHLFHVDSRSCFTRIASSAHRGLPGDAPPICIKL